MKTETIRKGGIAGAARPGERLRAAGWLVLACAFWGLSFPLGKALGDLHARLVPGVGSANQAIGLLAPRFILGALVLAVALRVRWSEITRAEWRLGLGLAGFSAGGVGLQFEAMQHTSAATSAFLTQFYVVLIPLFLAVRLRRMPGWGVIGPVVLVLAGVGVLARIEPGQLSMGRGEAGTLAATVFFSGQILWLGRKEFVGCRSGVTTLLMFAGQAAVFGFLACVVAPVGPTFGPLLSSGAWWVLIGLLTVFCTLGAFLLMNTWQPKIRATEAGLIYCVEPLFATGWAAFLPAMFSAWAGVEYANEPLTAVLVVGGGLILAANLWVQFAPQSEAKT